MESREEKITHFFIFVRINACEHTTDYTDTKMWALHGAHMITLHIFIYILHTRSQAYFNKPSHIPTLANKYEHILQFIRIYTTFFASYTLPTFAHTTFRHTHLHTHARRTVMHKNQFRSICWNLPARLERCIRNRINCSFPLKAPMARKICTGDLMMIHHLDDM